MHITADGVQGVGWGWGMDGREWGKLAPWDVSSPWRRGDVGGKKKPNYLPLAKDENELFDWRVL